MATAETETMIMIMATADSNESDLPPAADFVRLYRRHLRQVYAYVAWRVSHRETAEDITAQVFEKAWRSRAGYDRQKSAYLTWLMSIARNCVTDHLRRGSKAPAAARIDAAVDDPAVAAASAGESGAVAADPALMVLAAERRLELGAAVRTLEEREREIVSLKFGAGLSNREIARLLDISESNTGTLIYRSLEKLRNRLEGGIHDEK